MYLFKISLKQGKEVKIKAPSAEIAMGCLKSLNINGVLAMVSTPIS